MLRRKFRTGQDPLQDNVPKRNSYMMADLKIQTCPHRFKITMDDSDLLGGFNMIWVFSLKGPMLVDEALGSGFVDSGPRRWLSPPALAICSQAVIYGRRIISLDNRSHYHLELESLSSARFLFLSSSRVLLSCGPSVVVGQVTALSHRLHIDCINFKV